DRLNVFVQTLKIRFQPFPRKFGGPRLLGDLFGLDQAHEIQQGSAAEIVANDMSSGAHPHRHDLAHEVVGQLVGGERQAPGRIAGVGCVVCTCDLGAHRGLNAVRADQEVSSGPGTICKVQLDTGGSFFEAHDSAVRPHDLLIEVSCLYSEQIVKVSPVKLIIRRSVESFMFFGQRKLANDLARIMESKDIGGGPNRQFGNCLTETEAVKNVHRIGAQLYASTDLAQLRRLLIDLDVIARVHE